VRSLTLTRIKRRPEPRVTTAARNPRMMALELEAGAIPDVLEVELTVDEDRDVVLVFMRAFTVMPADPVLPA
jgi:hypothetical protein